jgi:hypothetical protein
MTFHLPAPVQGRIQAWIQKMIGIGHMRRYGFAGFF